MGRAGAAGAEPGLSDGQRPHVEPSAGQSLDVAQGMDMARQRRELRPLFGPINRGSVSRVRERMSFSSESARPPRPVVGQVQKPPQNKLQ